MRRIALCTALSLALACGGGPEAGSEGAPCAATSECRAGLTCLDGVCTARMDAGPRDAGPEPGDAGPPDAGADAGCLSGVFCGPTLTCCAAGDECVLGACLDACASGIRCGDALEACCAEGDVCSDVCVTPGAPCDFDFECAAAERCEPTLRRCLPRPADACEYAPPTGVFAPSLEWEWTGSAVDPGSDQIIVTPVVANLTDDDGDGDIDRDDVPDIVIVTFSGDAVGRLRALSGDDGRELWTADRNVCAYAGVAIGDLEGDGVPEVIAAGLAGSACRNELVPVIAFGPDGTVLWESHTAAGAPEGFYVGLAGSPSIADIDGDGTAEVIVEGGVLESDGTLRLRTARDLGANYSRGTAMTLVADIDPSSPGAELIGGNAVYRADGTELWRDGARSDGFGAIGRFGLAASGVEIAVVSYNEVFVRDALTGEIVWGPVTHPGGNYGGPPTVADFDGDGMPEIGVAGLSRYVVYDPDGAAPMLWELASVENGAAITGSSVFDFEADGRAEVVYADQCFLRVLDGRDGAVLFERSNSSGTHGENPVIVDVDNDGHAEIVVVSNSLAAASCTALPGFTGFTNGIRVWGDAERNWVPTRRIWNQHAYHITNVSEDARIPASEEPSWTRWNSYRQNAQDDARFAPDLLVSDVQIGEASCPASIVLRARITNAGSAGVRAGVPVSFYRGADASPATLLGTVLTTEPLLPGNSTTVELDVTLADPEERFDVLVVVDDDGTGASLHNECDEANNRAARVDAGCTRLF